MFPSFRRSVRLIAVLALGGSIGAGQAADTPQKRLEALFDEEWQYELRVAPERATSYGDDRYNDRLSDYSPEFFRKDHDRRSAFLARFTAIDPAGLSPSEALSRDLMIRGLREKVEEVQFKPWEMPVTQMGGPPLDIAELVSLTQFRTASDYEAYGKRLGEVPRVVDQVIANIRQGIRDRLIPPRLVLEMVAGEASDLATAADEASPFTKPLRSFPASIGESDRERLRASIIETIHTRVRPAYRRFAEFVKRDYVPHGRTEPGVWSLPNGAERYRFAVRQMTTTGLTPDEIHKIGLEQIAATEREMLAVARRLGFNDLASLNARIQQDRRHYASSGRQVVDLYAKYAAQMQAELPKLFVRLPKSPLVVVPMEEYREKNAVPADYTTGSPDGSRPGRINVNRYAPDRRLLLNVEAIAYHEGVPGHHLQLSLAQELPGLPAFRQHADYTAFVEGWALYSEVLGKEVGFYQDPYSDYGRLGNEMWRAIRLVVDTGVHYKQWSRQQMVDVFHKYTAMDEPNIQTEVDRYIAWPGQALGYKIGQLEILRLREEARRKLGSRFDLRGFHDAVLSNGALPLDALKTRVDEWIASRARD